MIEGSPLHKLSDDALVTQARTGQNGAFNELVLRHRKKALNWAGKITNDAHLAEDVVQEALINAFMQLDSLEHIDRFVPWFQRIIRNQALMLVRRGGPYAKERPFSAFTRASDASETGTDDPIELILNQLARNSEQIQQADQDPFQAAVRQETSAMILSLLYNLNPKEREVFEAHFFNHYSTHEIAAMCKISSTNVYTTLSRSRRKLQNKHFQSNLTRYLSERAKKNTAVNKHLGDRGIYFGEVWDTFALSVIHAVQYTEKNHYSMADIMGLTGQAFRLQIHRDHLDLTGPTAYSWRSMFSKGLLNMGFGARTIGEGLRIPQTDDLVLEAFSFVHNAIDQGMPVIVWGVEQPFFALINGYNDESRIFRVTGLFESTILPYERFGRDWSADLFLLSLGNAYDIEPAAALRGALSIIITHSEGQERTIKQEYVQGIAAYDVWIEALRDKGINAAAHAYTVWCTSNARYFAVQFLEGIAKEAAVYGEYGKLIAPAAAAAAQYYAAAAAALADLRKRFPFPDGGNMEINSLRNEGIALLEQAKASERRGLEHLKTMLNFLC
ncbi:RNA polymerase sigma factor [Paenibacillus wynnii]|uniref:RNA polymerase sigma factor n=1 Tax=Paenibacillus wynnii TaxID=268407 RepID=UPI002791CA92|nr:sigma-70 family RNA polymerase sigma factor [Paenibacillus wynnii]MDQ0194260.1 RNA polymerase sigma factor (sigma-70 family) [Paenibacillus wynnii]